MHYGMMYSLFSFSVLFLYWKIDRNFGILHFTTSFATHWIVFHSSPSPPYVIILTFYIIVFTFFLVGDSKLDYIFIFSLKTLLVILTEVSNFFIEKQKVYIKENLPI